MRSLRAKQMRSRAENKKAGKRKPGLEEEIQFQEKKRTQIFKQIHKDIKMVFFL